MSNYLTQTINDVTATATAHQLASEYYDNYSKAIKYPQTVGPVLVMMVSFIGAMFGNDTEKQQYYFYANEVVGLLTLLALAIDRYFGWSKQSTTHANAATQFFKEQERLTRIKRQQLLRSQSTENIQKAVEKVEENYMALLHKHRRPHTRFQQRALEVMRATQSMVDAIERRRLSESKSKQNSNTRADQKVPDPEIKINQ